MGAAPGRRRPTVVTVVGARPQFVKAAPVGRALRQRVRQLLVHTGQHYDDAMSAAFFRELGLPAPYRNLGIGSGPHGRMTGRMLEALEELLGRVAPDLVLVFGDTNSTLAAALAAAKMAIPVAHVEAGLRSYDPHMPEEVNRRLTDHVSTLLFCPTPAAVRNLAREGVRDGVHQVGDVMMDVLRSSLARARRAAPASSAAPPGSYYLVTLHRQENVDDAARLRALIAALDSLPHPALFPVHPRTRQRLDSFRIRPRGALRLLEPAPYLQMLRLVAEARAVLTDSGGLQKEAFLLGVPCVTLRDRTEWTESLRGGANRLAGADPARVTAAVRAVERRRPRWDPAATYGDGRAAERIARIISGWLRTSASRRRGD
jgi:UDP-GlcNAc3NAcA epimerase